MAKNLPLYIKLPEMVLEAVPPSSTLLFSRYRVRTASHSYICIYICICIIWVSLAAQLVKSLLAMQETQVWYPGWEDALEKGMATRSSIPAWRTPWTEEPGGLESMGSQRVGHDYMTNTHTHFYKKRNKKLNSPSLAWRLNNITGPSRLLPASLPTFLRECPLSSCQADFQIFSHDIYVSGKKGWTKRNRHSSQLS